MSILSKHMKSPLAMKERIPDSKLRSKTTISTSQKTKGNKSKFKQNVRSTVEDHDTEGDKKDVKFYIDSKEKTKGSKSKFKQFAGTEDKGYVSKVNTRGKRTERKTTKGGTKRRIKRAEKNLKDI